MSAVTCPKCGRKYKLPANAEGRLLKCGCGARFRARAIATSTKSASDISPPPVRAPQADAADGDDLELEAPPPSPVAVPSSSDPLATASSAAPGATALSLGATAGWQRKADRTFRVIACLAPLVAAGITYTQIDPNGPNGEFNRITYSVLALIAAGAIGILLAVKGIRFDEESFKLRRKGLYFIGFGLVMGAAGAGCAYLAWGGKRVGRNSMYAFICFSICVFALAFGLLQVITGHDIRSATKFREQ